MEHERTHWRRLAAFVGATMLVAACGGDAAPATTTSTTSPPTTTASDVPTTSTQASTTSQLVTTTTVATTTTDLPAQQAVVAYFLLQESSEEDGGPHLVPVYRESDGDGASPAELALEALLAGPTGEEREGIPGMSTAIPDSTRLRGVDVSGGVASVDLSSEYDDGGGTASMQARLAQVVYTVTRLPDIESVQFSIEGEPVSVFSSEGIELSGPQARQHYLELLPAIFVDAPAWGEPVMSPVTVSGTSNVFEATSQVILTDDDGLPLDEETVTATCGTGCWGAWEVELDYEVDREQFGAVIVWENSAEDGTRIHVREYPVRLR